jgi:hypothetical protein
MWPVIMQTMHESTSHDFLQIHPFGGYPNANIYSENALQTQGDAMADDLSKRGPQDRSRVNVNEPWELTYWCAEFKCNEIQLRAAVKAVGVMVTDVRRHLSK